MNTTQGEHDQTEALRLADELEDSLESHDGSSLTARCQGIADDAAAELRRLHAQVAALTAQPADADNLRKALQFYADGHHFTKSDGDAWDTVSGEPQNYWCDEAGTATVEDGSIAKLALAGHPIKFEDEDATAQPAAPQGVAYAELPQPAGRITIEDYPSGATYGPTYKDVDAFTHGQMRLYADDTHTLRASHGQAPAGAAELENLQRTAVGWQQRAEFAEREWQQCYRVALIHGADPADFKNKPGTPWHTAQAAPAAGITVEQVEDAIGLQSTAWDTIGAEKIVEAVIRLANAKAPAAGAVAGPDGRMSHELRRMIEGMSVSVDVSTGDHDSGHRYFGTVTEVMDCNGDKHGVTLLVQDAEPNFAPTPAAQADSVLEDAARLLRQILAASQDGDSDTHLSAHFVSRIETITKPGGAA